MSSGNIAKIPPGWIEDVLNRSVLDFQNFDEVWICGDIDLEGVRNTEPSEEGYLRMLFNDGTIVAITSNQISSSGKKDTFIQPLAISMLPPKISKIAKIEFVWYPKGWPAGKDLPLSAIEKVDEIIASWTEFSIPEAKIWEMMRQAVLANLDIGLVVEDRWFPIEDVEKFLAEFSGGEPEREAVRFVLGEIIESGEGLVIDADGSTEALDCEAIRCRTNSLHLFLVGTWGEFGLDILSNIGFSGKDADEYYSRQLEKPVSFGKFLRGIKEQYEERSLLSRFPWPEGALSGLCGLLHDLVIKAVTEGIGRANAQATKLRGKIRSKAVGWSWLCTQKKESGQEWHFEQSSRDLGGDWILPVTELWEIAEEIISCEKEQIKELSETYVTAMKEFKVTSGCSEPLTPVEV